MKAEKLTAGEADRIRQAMHIIDGAFLWSATPEGRDYWLEVSYKLRAIADNGTTDGKPWVEPVEPHSIDSRAPGFVMPHNWHGRLVDAIDGRDIAYEVRLIGWNVSGKALHPYCVTDEDGWMSWWSEHIRFADDDACDWSDDDTVEPC